MLTAIKAEYKKLTTTRSTYVLVGLALALVLFVTFYIQGYRAVPENLSTGYLMSESINSISVVTLFAVMVGILLMTHEYRYNTINYTLTSSNSRTKVLLAKIIVISVFAILFATLIWGLAPLATYLGISAKGLELPSQQIYFWDSWWKCAFFAWGFSIFGLLLAALIRNQIGTIVFLLIVPNTVESIFAILLKQNSIYMPFTSLANVVGQTGLGTYVSPLTSAILFTLYMVGGWAIAWYLFLRRDAN